MRKLQGLHADEVAVVGAVARGHRDARSIAWRIGMPEDRVVHICRRLCRLTGAASVEGAIRCHLQVLRDEIAAAARQKAEAAAANEAKGASPPTNRPPPAGGGEQELSSVSDDVLRAATRIDGFVEKTARNGHHRPQPVRVNDGRGETAAQTVSGR